MSKYYTSHNTLIRISYRYDPRNELHNAKRYTLGNHQPLHNHIILLIMSSVTAHIIYHIMGFPMHYSIIKSIINPVPTMRGKIA